MDDVTMSAVDSVRVAAVVEDVAREEVLSRFRGLRPDEVREKAPGDLVTTADLRSEERLVRELSSLLPGSSCLGEEEPGSRADAERALAAGKPVWIIDPLDGTSNFVRGDPRFSVVVCLAAERRFLGAWLSAPAMGLSGRAWAGRGAWVNGSRVRPVWRRERESLRVVVTDAAYRTAEDDRQVSRLRRSGVALRDCSGVGVTYLELALGVHDAAVFGWTTVWDHAAGLLLHAEAGGWSAAGERGQVRLLTEADPPVVVAPDAEVGRRLRAVACPDR
jgi:fructose-1,6-bisphosphatase/inositol monophosphatase family enzyme